MKTIALVITTALLISLATASTAGGASLESAAAGDHRAASNIARNDSRHPVETLNFFGIKDGMTVIEIWPGGGGWYTEVLAPYLRDGGKFYAANYDGSTGVKYFEKNAQKFRDKLAAQPDVYDQVIVTNLMPPNSLEAAPAGTADMVLTFRNLHNWVRDGRDEAMFKAMYDALKTGGVLGLVAHRGTDEMLGAESAKKGYLAESEALRLAASAGFKFVDRSEVNANPNDTKDYPDGVWTLPPSYRLGDTDKEKYTAIGESDRMTLKFVKP